MSVEAVTLRPLNENNGNSGNNEDMFENKAFEDDATTGEKTTHLNTIEIGTKVGLGYDEDDGSDNNAYQRWLLSTQQSVATFYDTRRKVIWTIIAVVLTLGYLGYFGYAMYYRFGDEGSKRLLGFTIFGFCVGALVMLSRIYSTEIDQLWKGTYNACQSSTCDRLTTLIKWFLRVGVFVAVTVYVIVDIAIDHPENLITVAGLALYILIFYVTSVCPAKVNWHTIFWGFALQYVFALLILRTQWGYDIFEWLGDRVTEFLEHTHDGIVFVFGNNYEDHFFAMKILSIVVFFFSFINVLYYLGVMQAVISVLGRFLAFCMGTSPVESINAAANIFFSMQESLMSIRPFLDDMTKSELHAIMTSGFATIAGSVLGAYISFGVPANHLISASVMSAPAALAISKLSCPETETSKGSSKDYYKLHTTKESNIVEAASNGASASLKVVGNIAVNVLAFLALLAFLNATLTWLGNRVGVDKLTFEFICSYLLYPVPFFMGVETGDCRKVAELIGIKTFTNEFIAYSHLKTLIANRHTLANYTEIYNGTGWYWRGGDVILNVTGDVLIGGVVSEKSEVISTYALCGFANFGAIGSMLGALGALVPDRKSELAKLVVRAMICGNVACFLTACIAGLLYKPL